MDLHQKGAYYYRIKGLFIPFATPAKIDESINQYIDKIGQHTQRLEDYFNNQQLDEFVRELETIQALLKSVYAKQCEACVISLLHAAKTRDLSFCDQLLQQTIADFLLLSIEMQKEQKVGTSNAPKYLKVDKHEEIARDLMAIGRLIDIGNYEKAQHIVHDMKELDSVFVQLARIIDAKDYKKAKEFIKTSEKEQIGLIKKQTNNADKLTKTILAVDDKPEILTSVSNALRSHFKVLGAPSGSAALEIIKSQAINLFLLDIEMPEMNGFELAAQIRTDQRHKNTALIFFTANSSRNYISKALTFGANDFIVKPANSVALLTKVRRYMD